MSYTVKLINFVGPLDLLLQLIERQELEITDISLAAITSDYLDHINKLDVATDDLTWFSQVAAQLLYIKSQTLIKESTEEELNSDQLQELADQLKLYRVYKRASDELVHRLTASQFVRPAISDRELGGLDYKNLDQSQLSTVMQRLILDSPQKSYYQHQLTPKIPLAGKLREIKGMLASSPQSLSSIVNSGQSQLETIALLLAVLELLKQRSVELYDSPDGLALRQCL